jgi:hypothetical protein
MKVSTTTATLLTLALAGRALSVDVSDIAIDESMYSVLVDASNDGTPTYFSGRRNGQVALKPAFVHSLKSSAGITPFSAETGDVIVDMTLLTSSSARHIDRLPPDEKGYRPSVPAGDRVGFYALNTNTDAYFDADDMCVPIEEGKLIHFDGNIPHHTVVKGGSVSLIGPFHLKTMKGVGSPVPPPVVPPPVLPPVSAPLPDCVWCSTGKDGDAEDGCVYHVQLGNDDCLYLCIKKGDDYGDGLPEEAKPEPGCPPGCRNSAKFPQCQPPTP